MRGEIRGWKELIVGHLPPEMRDSMDEWIEEMIGEMMEEEILMLGVLT